MALVRLHPASELQREIDSLTNTFWGSPGSSGSSPWQPRVDIVESDDVYALHAEVPGVSKDDIRVTVKDGFLILEGEKRPSYDENSVGRGERFFGSFYRSFRLADHVDVDAMSATCRDGVLHLTVPKLEAARPRQIEVTVE